MSHSVLIDYRNMKGQALGQCKVLCSKLCDVEKALDFLEESSKSIISEKALKYKEYLLSIKKELTLNLKNIESGIENVKDFAYDYENNIIPSTNDISFNINDLERNLTLMYSLVNSDLSNSVQESNQKLDEELRFGTSLNTSLITQIELVSDFTLREYMYLEAIKKTNNSLIFEEIQQLAFNKMNNIITKNNIDNKDTIIKEAKVIMKDLPDDVVEEVIKQDISIVKEKAYDAIVSEEVRKDTIKTIRKIITSRGFVVSNNSIKIDRIKNIVNMVGIKANGERAAFTVNMEGQFTYKFDNYEGQACQKDIQPFMDDLENLYNIKVDKKKEIWSNPDKLTKKTYQTQNYNKQ